MSSRKVQKIVCMGDGVQDDGLQAIPRYFDFQREVIDGSFLDININRFLIKLVFQHLSAETIKPWNALTQVDFINIIEHSYRFHQKLNANAIASATNGQQYIGLRAARDADILEYMDSSVRMITPNDVYLRAEPFSIKPLIAARSQPEEL